MAEHPPLGKTFVAGYSENDTAFPILAVAKDARLFKVPPTPGSTYGLSSEAIIEFPNNKFTGVERVSEERILWVYELVPGKVFTVSSSIDPEMNCQITVTRQLKLLSAITEGASIVAGKLVVTEAVGAKGTLAYEQVTTIDPPAKNSFSNAQLGTRAMAYQWPARIDIAQLDLYGTAIGYHQPKARLLEATTKKFWVISDTKPTLTFDRIIGHTITINDVTYNDVLHDATTRAYNGSMVFIPATTPSYLQYVTSWIGQEKLVDGAVTATRYQKLWEVEGVFIVME